MISTTCIASPYAAILTEACLVIDCDERVTEAFPFSK